VRQQVREVSHKGASSLIEWSDEQGTVNRSIVPRNELMRENGVVLVNNPDEGAPYGEQWEEIVDTQVGPQSIANLLRQNGIWTYDDFINNTATVTSVFNQYCSNNLQHFREAVRLRQTVTQEERKD
jgi:hypothetical protein